MQHLANALLTTLAIPILNASQNVWSTLNAPETRLVSIRSAKTLVLGCAVLMPSAQHPITMQCASVNLGILAMHLWRAKESQQVSFKEP